MLEFITVTLSIIIGFITFNIATHPYSIVRNSLPQVKVRRFQFCPVIRLQVKGKTIHLHHWFNISILLLITLTPLISGGFLDYVYTRGFLVGGVLQGLTFPDARRIIS